MEGAETEEQRTARTDRKLALDTERAFLRVWIRELLGVPVGVTPTSSGEALRLELLSSALDDVAHSILRIRFRLTRMPQPDEDLAPFNDGLRLNCMCKVVARFLGSKEESSVLAADYWAHKWLLFARSAAEHCGVFDAGLQLPARGKGSGMLVTTFHSLVRVMEETLKCPVEYEPDLSDVLLQSYLPAARLEVVPPRDHNASVLHRIADDTRSTMLRHDAAADADKGEADEDKEGAADTEVAADVGPADVEAEPITLHDFESIVNSGALGKKRRRRRRDPIAAEVEAKTEGPE